MQSKKSGYWKLPKANIYFDWQSVENPDLVLILVHGLGEHTGRYQHVKDWFNQKNIACLGFDHYGHGQSGYRKGDVPDYSHYMAEIKKAVVEARSVYPDKTIGLYGHSMGGNHVLYYALHEQDIDFVISSAAWLQLPKPPNPLLIWIARLANYFGGIVQDNGLDLDGLSREPSVRIAYEKDPLVHPKISSKAAIGNLDAAHKLLNAKQKTAIPTLVMHGTDDRLTACSGSEAFCTLHQGDITFKKWEGWFHELHNEPEKEKLFLFVYDWLQNKIKVK